ncbi:MAG: T9SS type A sorting domain-containing protein [Bacteroidales bacterium]|nr:T9SS type A sorting domain-containing protein [Bacteroidales bacterium]
MKHILQSAILIALCFCNYSVFSQMSYGGEPYSFKHSNISEAVPFIEMDRIDAEQLLAEDALVGKEQALRIGVVQPINYTKENCGRIDYLPDGGYIWRVGIYCPDATFASINFSKFIIPKEAELFVYTKDKDFVIGKFTHENQMEGEIFYPQDIPGEAFIIEYYEPGNAEFNGILEMDEVLNGYRDIFNVKDDTKGGLGSANGTCHPNAVCLDAQWHDQINSVVCYTMTAGGYVYMCSGAMVNNTARDGKKYVLTADHCYNSGATWKFYFNYQTSTCNGTTGPYNRSATGCNVRARGSASTSSDFMLLEITGTINSIYNAYLAGWNNTTTTPSSGMCIHHPGGDLKKISTPATIRNGALVYSNRTKYWITTWNYSTGTTEQGSSGSPLFNQNKLIVGQLYAGSSSCVSVPGNAGQAGPSGEDFYGKFSNSWTNNNNTNNAKKLKPWLDPNNTGATTLQGEYLNNVGIANYTEVVNALTVYPNPSNGIVTVSGSFESNEGVCNIYNTLGANVLSRNISLEPEFTMNLNDLMPGIYFIEINDNTNVYRSKIIITK